MREASSWTAAVASSHFAIAASLARVDPDIPYGIIAFFPEHELRDVPSPNYHQMVVAFEASVDAGLRNVRLGNLGRFVRTNGEYKALFQMGAI